MAKQPPPATKEDIRSIMEELGKLYDANERWKNEILDQFALTVEIIREDLKGANRDRIEMHEDRIVRLEKHARLAV